MQKLVLSLGFTSLGSYNCLLVFLRKWSWWIPHGYHFLFAIHLLFPSLSQPHFEGSVRSPLTLSKMGLRSPPGLLKTQSAIAGVKTHCIEVLFIPLERSWSVDVQNGLTWAIWTSAARVMVKGRARSQINNLTPDH